MRIFVTGATGFVSHALCKHLSTQHWILALIHDFHKDPVFLGYNVGVQGDVRSFSDMRGILTKFNPDAVIHLAAQAIVAHAQKDPYSTFTTNVQGTAALLQAVKEYAPSAWFLHFSTDKVYGEGLDKKETDSLQPSGVYESSKVASDIIAQTYMKTLHGCITRTCNIYGPGDLDATRIVPKSIRACLANISPEIYTQNGKLGVREYIYIDDVCSAVRALMEGKETGIWNISSGLILSSREVVHEILRHFKGLDAVEHDQTTYKELSSQSLNNAKYREWAGSKWHPTSFNEGIQQTVEWWKHGFHRYDNLRSDNQP